MGTHTLFLSHCAIDELEAQSSITLPGPDRLEVEFERDWDE